MGGDATQRIGLFDPVAVAVVGKAADAGERVGARHLAVHRIVGEARAAAQVVGGAEVIPHLVVGIALGERVFERLLVGRIDKAQALAHIAVERAVGADERVAHAVGLGDELVELVVGVGGDLGVLSAVDHGVALEIDVGQHADLHRGAVAAAVVAVDGLDAVRVLDHHQAVIAVEGELGDVAVLVGGGDLVAVGVELMLHGVAHRQAGYRIGHRGPRFRDQPIVAVVGKISGAPQGVGHGDAVARCVIDRTGGAAHGVHFGDQFIFLVVGEAQQLALGGRKLRAHHHAHAIQIGIEAVLRHLADGVGRLHQQVVRIVDVLGEVAVVVPHADAIAHAVVGVAGGVGHQLPGGVRHRRGGDRHQTVVLAIGVGGGVAVGVGGRGAIPDHVIGIAGDAVLGGVAIGRGVGDPDQQVVAAVYIDDRVAVGVPDGNAIAHRVIGVDRDVELGVGDGQRTVVVVVGESRHPAVAVGEGQAVAEMIVARKAGVAFGVDGLDVLAEGVVEVLRHLLLGRGDEVVLVQVDRLLGDVAKDIVGKAREIAARAGDLREVLLGVVAVGGGKEGQDRLFLGGGELRHELALPGQGIDVAEVPAQVAKVSIVAAGDGVRVGVDDGDQVLQRI